MKNKRNDGENNECQLREQINIEIKQKSELLENRKETNRIIRYHSPDFLFSFTSTSDLVLLTLRDRLLMDLIRASGILEKRGESTLFSGMKKFFTANIVTIMNYAETTILLNH